MLRHYTSELRATLLSIADVVAGSFDVAAAKALFGSAAKKLLDALVDRSLLEYNRTDRRYVVHTLVKVGRVVEKLIYVLLNPALRIAYIAIVSTSLTY